jgi:hypothetical protein
MPNNIDELANVMSENLLTDKTKIDNIANAISCLDKAANIFDNIGDYKTAEVITHIIEKFAGKE